MELKVAVVGATGAVGREILKTLSERHFPAAQVVALASEGSVGKEVSFGEEAILKTQALSTYSFAGTHMAIFSAGGERSAKYAPIAVAAGTYVIDNSSYFRLNTDVPLVVPEINGTLLRKTTSACIIANPNCVATPLALVLKALMGIANIRRVVLSTYQSTSGKGRRAMDELFRQCKSIMVGDSLVREEFPKQIAFNLIPQIDSFQADGSTLEEWKISQETKKILEVDMGIAVTCVRVPVFIGHCMAVSIEFDSDVSVKNAHTALKKMPGISLVDNLRDELYATPVEIAGEDDVFVSRVRTDTSVPHGLMCWIASDNLRKGAALNAVQIAEQLLPLFRKTLA